MSAYGDTVPIAAQAAQGALALLRTSGEGTLELLARIFSRPRALLEAPGHTVVHGWILPGPAGAESGAGKIDEVLVSVYRAPRSYTGEEGADISCHGGSAAAAAILESLRGAGFRDALPGEFTFRAFMNGKLDLTRAESVMELVSAKTQGGLERAVRRLSGLLEQEIRQIREKLLEVVSAAELYLDYSEDEIEVSPDEAAGRLPRREEAEEALRRLRALAASYRREQIYREGALAVIAGRPNAGKSSLFNALLNEDRSIVTGTPGTTRDWIEASLSLEGIPLRLADTAGIREIPASPGESREEAETLGIERSRELIKEADIILYVVDGSAGLTPEDGNFIRLRGEKLIPLWNKTDVREPADEVRRGYPRLVAVSARTGRGMEELCGALAGALKDFPDISGGEELFPAGLGTRRQKDLTEKAADALEEALAMADREEPLDMTAPLLREALHYLGEITGEVSPADILETMFSRFCLGK
ncbi:MAG: tRNA uridine-5-carboxymethylaminomethyl(34) synthesis GTPase MnmE [Spirochaetaceae bacterium]|jgi:tRNA modification GTPase|nr:tRNA uridine-5-carboxymethylaminomethyl(34) synthesis GTPase MnmE [Spirochaetaceae bacterium]